MYEDIKLKFENLEKQLQDPEIVNDIKKLTETSRAHADLKEAVLLIADYNQTADQISQNKTILETENDPELKEMAETELPELETKLAELKSAIDKELNPADPNDKKDVLVEIRAGTGGDESALFAAELFRMYSRYAENNQWKINILNTSHIGIGGFKEIIFEVHGKNVYGFMKFEAGTHRVQRVPETEKQGRVHTSTITVAVMPEAEEVDVEIKNEDLRIDVYASSGPGGQSVNTTNSAVRITHIPTGVIAQCQDQKSQQQNKVKALQVIRSRVLARIEDEKRSKESAQRKSQIGNGDRSEKIRTYNYPQDRITDHRIKKSWSNMQNILAGNLDDVFQSLQDASADQSVQ